MSGLAKIARENALPLEVKKDGLTQRQDGSWILRLRINPDDMRSELAEAAMGSRWMMALVEINDDETPKDRSLAGQRLVQRAGIICSNPQFQTFLRTEWPINWEQAVGNDDEERAVVTIYSLCEIQSRKELATNQKASAKFEELLGKYEGWRRGIE